jgi:hypothetical protein
MSIEQPDSLESPEESPRLRREPLPADALIVARGWDGGPAAKTTGSAAIIADARRFKARYPVWDRYGVSAFVCSTADEVEWLSAERLWGHSVVRVFHRACLGAAGVDVLPTFAAPHVTLAHRRLDALVFCLRRCEHEDLANRPSPGWAVTPRPETANDSQPESSVGLSLGLPVDLPVDLQTEDESGLPWGLMEQARGPNLIYAGGRILVGNPVTKVPARVVEIAGKVVRVQLLRSTDPRIGGFARLGEPLTRRIGRTRGILKSGFPVPSSACFESGSPSDPGSSIW